jgi:hypothetical protein
MTNMLLEISTENLDTVLESDNLQLEIPENVVDVLTIQTADALDILEVGPQGPPGGSAATYTHTQATPAATWTIPHNLNTVPSVILVIDSFPNEQVVTDVTYPDLNTAVVSWPSPESGKAYLR